MSNPVSMPSSAPAASHGTNAIFASSSSSSTSRGRLGLAGTGSSLVSASSSTSACINCVYDSRLRSYVLEHPKPIKLTYLSTSDMFELYGAKIDDSLSPYFRNLEIECSETLSEADTRFVIETALSAVQAHISGSVDRTKLYADFKKLDKLGVKFIAHGHSKPCSYPSSFR